MKRLIGLLLSVSMMINSAAYTVFAEEENRLLAFPGAEGGGMYTLGARAADNCEIYHVTNLNDSGAGSFRDAVSQGNRIIVFDVSGTIMLKSRLMIRNGNLTILGQTAPGEGICIGGESVAFEGKNTEEGLLRNVIVRYLRFRMGDNSFSAEDGVGVKFAENVILDHCSVSWSVDECLSSYAVKNFTAQWCIVSESLNNSVHPKGAHGYGGIWGGINSSFHHNLVSHHTSRNPRIAGTTVKTYLGTANSDSAVDVRNNVFYAWGHGCGYGGENGVRVNFVNNYYKPSKEAGSEINIYESYTGGDDNIGSCIYANGNVMEGNETITKNNRSGVKAHNDLGDYIYIEDISDGITDNGIFKPNDQYIYDYPIATDTAEEAYQKVITQAGASLKRDQTDTRVVNNLINGTLPKGRLSGIGFIDSQNDVGGWCRLIGGEKPLDSDNDGIPDEWEDKNGLDKNDASDSIKTAESGYMNIEEYANSLVANANERTHLNKSLIYDEIDRTNKMREEKYIAEYFSKEFEECDKVIATADSILLDDELTNEKIKAKADELKEKNDIISESGSYKLLRAIDAAENIKYSAYTNITWDNLQNALKKGNELKDTETNDEKLKNAAQSIYECIDALEKKTDGTVKLAWYLDMRDKENKFDYNDEDWANFKSEIASAREMIYEREDISEEEYNSIKKKIDDIYENIRKPYTVETVYYRDFEDKNNESPNYGNSKQEYGNETSFSKQHASSYPFQITTEKGTNFIGTYQLEFSFYEENVNSGILVGFPYKNLYITDEVISQNEWHRMRIDFDSYSKDVYVSIDGKPKITKMNFYETQYDDYNDIELMMYTTGSSIRCIDDIVLKEKILRTNTPNDSSWGDVDLDGKVTANDAALVQNYLSGKILLSDEQKYNASVLGIDNDITSGCAVRILEQVYDNSLKKTIDDRPYTDPKYLTTTESTSETTTESTSETTIASINEIDDLDTAKIPTGDHSEDYIQGNFTIGREFSVEEREAVYQGVDFPFTDKGKVFYKAIRLKGNSDTDNADSYIKVNVSSGERLTLTYTGTNGKYAPSHLYLSEDGELNEIVSSYTTASNGLLKIFYDDISSGEYIITFSKDVFVYDVVISALSDERSED